MNSKNISYKDILQCKEYMKTVIAGIINRFGDSIDSIALTWLVYQVTQSASWSAIIFGINRIPTIFLQPFVGASIEGKGKKKIMVITDIIRGVCVGFIATAFLMGFLNQWIILACTLSISCAEAFRLPAANALIPKLLDKDYYDFGLSLNSGANSVAELIGLGAAGVIIAAFSIETAIYIDMATFFISGFIILTLKVKEEKREKFRLTVNEYGKTLKDGFRYLYKNPLLKFFALMAVFLNGVLVPFNSLQAPLISEVLHADEAMLSILSIAMTIGMFVGASAFPYIRSRLSVHFIACLGGYSFGIYYFILVLVGCFITTAPLIYLIIVLSSLAVGGAISITVNFSNVEFMKNVEDAYIARVSSLLSACCVASIPIVSFLVSALAGWVPTVVLFIIAGVLDLLIFIPLCNKKRVQALMEQREVTIDEKECRDIQTDQSI